MLSVRSVLSDNFVRDKQCFNNVKALVKNYCSEGIKVFIRILPDRA